MVIFIVHSYRPSLLSTHANLLQTGIGLRGVPVSSINRGPLHGSYQIDSFYETIRKSFSLYVNWRCTAITFIIITTALLFLMSYFIGKSGLHYMSSNAMDTLLKQINLIEAKALFITMGHIHISSV